MVWSPGPGPAQLRPTGIVLKMGRMENGTDRDPGGPHELDRGRYGPEAPWALAPLAMRMPRPAGRESRGRVDASLSSCPSCHHSCTKRGIFNISCVLLVLAKMLLVIAMLVKYVQFYVNYGRIFVYVLCFYLFRR